MKDITGFILLFWLIRLIISLVIYFLPTAIVIHRKHRNKVPIIVLNILAGWSIVGWVAAFVWSFTSNIDEIERVFSDKVITPKKEKLPVYKNETKNKAFTPQKHTEKHPGFVTLTPEERSRRDAEALEKLNKG